MPEVFTYGSLMYPEIVETVIGRPVAIGEIRDAVLEGYRRVAIPDQPYPTGVAASGHRIEGKLLGPITEQELERLDQYEAAFYIRIPVSVSTRDGIRQAFAYIDGRSPLPFATHDWDPETFRQTHLTEHVERIKQWKASGRDHS